VTDNPYQPPQGEPQQRFSLRHLLIRVGYLLLSFILALVGWLIGVYCAMLIGLSQYDNYLHYAEGPIGFGLGIAGALVGLFIPALLRARAAQRERS
jgi:hypothetical protein